MSDEARFKAIQPEGWARPRGYSNGVVASGTIVRVSGQFGKSPEAKDVGPDSDFGAQWGLALKNIVTVVEAAGGKATDIVMLRAYLLNMQDFTDFGAAVGAGWAEALGKHFPAMTMVQVSGLLDPNAKLEIEAEAVLGN